MPRCFSNNLVYRGNKFTVVHFVDVMDAQWNQINEIADNLSDLGVCAPSQRRNNTNIGALNLLIFAASRMREMPDDMQRQLRAGKDNKFFRRIQRQMPVIESASCGRMVVPDVRPPAGQLRLHPPQTIGSLFALRSSVAGVVISCWVKMFG